MKDVQDLLEKLEHVSYRFAAEFFRTSFLHRRETHNHMTQLCTDGTLKHGGYQTLEMLQRCVIL